MHTTRSNNTSLKQPRALLIQMPGRGANACMRQTPVNVATAIPLFNQVPSCEFPVAALRIYVLNETEPAVDMANRTNWTARG